MYPNLKRHSQATTARGRYSDAQNLLKKWIQIRSLVDRCKKGHNFDWDTLLNESEFLAPRAKELLLCLIDAPDDFPTMKSLAEYLNLALAQVCRECIYLRIILTRVGVPIEELHPLLLQSNKGQKLKGGICLHILRDCKMPLRK